MTPGLRGLSEPRCLMKLQASCSGPQVPDATTSDCKFFVEAFSVELDVRVFQHE